MNWKYLKVAHRRQLVQPIPRSDRSDLNMIEDILFVYIYWSLHLVTWQRCRSNLLME